jgi:hypothetical protein
MAALSAPTHAAKGARRRPLHRRRPHLRTASMQRQQSAAMLKVIRAGEDIAAAQQKAADDHCSPACGGGARRDVSRANLRPCLSCGHVEIAKGCPGSSLKSASGRRCATPYILVFAGGGSITQLAVTAALHFS